MVTIPDTNADPGKINAVADDFREIAGRITGTGEGVVDKIMESAVEFSDLISPKIRGRGQKLMNSVENAFRATFYAASVTSAWATDVARFKRERERILNEWQRFIYMQMHTSGPDPQAREAMTRDRKRKETMLQVEANKLYRDFQEQAKERGSQLGDGPTSEHLRNLAKEGALGWGGYNLWPRVAPPPLLVKGRNMAELVKKLLSGKATAAERALALEWLGAFSNWGNAMQRSGHVLDSDEKDHFMFLLGALNAARVAVTNPQVREKLAKLLQSFIASNDPKINMIFKNPGDVAQLQSGLREKEWAFGLDVEAFKNRGVVNHDVDFYTKKIIEGSDEVWYRGWDNGVVFRGLYQDHSLGGGFKWDKDHGYGGTFGANGNLGLGRLTYSHEHQWGSQSLSYGAEGYAGGRAQVDGFLGYRRIDGEQNLGARANVDAFVGAEAAANGRYGTRYGSVGGMFGVQAGAGAVGEAHLNYSGGKIHVGGKLGLAWGVGLKVGVNADVDVKNVGGFLNPFD